MPFQRSRIALPILSSRQNASELQACHNISEANGGGFDWNNFLYGCDVCNRKISDKNLVDVFNASDYAYFVEIMAVNHNPKIYKAALLELGLNLMNKDDSEAKLELVIENGIKTSDKMKVSL